MRLTCPTCGASYDLPEANLPPGGSHVQCSACHTRWFARPAGPPPERPSEDEIITRLETRAARPAEPGGAAARPAPSGTIPFPRSPRPAGPGPAAAAAADATAGAPDATAGATGLAEPAGDRTETEAETVPAEGTKPPKAAPGRTTDGAVALGGTHGDTARPRATDGDAAPPPARVAAAPARPSAAAVAAAAVGPLRPRPNGERAPPAPPPPLRGGGRGWLGFLAAAMVAAAGLALYLQAGEVAARAPAAGPAAAAYAARIDAAREWIETRLGPLRDRLTGG